jgi:hypothetical protein
VIYGVASDEVTDTAIDF